MQIDAATHSRKWEVIAAFVFGCVFLVTVIAIAIFNKNPTPFEYTIFRITIALAAAGIGAILPGFLHVRFKNLLRASGALALFAIVYFLPPAALPVDPPLEDELTSDAKIPIDNWLSLVDNGQYKNAYLSMADGFKKRYPFAQFEELISGERSRLGKTGNRIFLSTTPYMSPPGAPKGYYRQYVYRTSFGNETRPIYEVVWAVGEQKEWRVTGFNTMIKMDSGQFVPYEPK